MNTQAKGLVLLSIFLFLFFFAQLLGQNPPRTMAVDFKKLAEFGTAIGGIFTIVSIFFFYQTLTYQIKTSKKQSKASSLGQFESRVFELLRYHRENVEVTEMRNPNHYGDKYYKGHKAFREIYRQFDELVGYVSSFLAEVELKSIYLNDEEFEKEIKTLKRQGVNSGIYKTMNEINIAYLILFFGVDKEGRVALETKMSAKYKVSYFTKLFDNLSERIALWSLEDSEGKEDKEKWKDLKGEMPYRGLKIKFYGGHQYRLGHYFRHLFQTISYIDNTGVSYEDNYEYTKIIRAQLSSYEQKLLFINSISDLGRTWELDVHQHYKEKLNMDLSLYFTAKKLVTKFDLVRNIPDNLGVIKISDVYPDLVFDGNREGTERSKLNAVFNKGYY